MTDIYVYDPAEHRQWGPFESEDAANEFVESDKYLSSNAWITGDMRLAAPPATYKPEEYND